MKSLNSMSFAATAALAVLWCGSWVSQAADTPRLIADTSTEPAPQPAPKPAAKASPGEKVEPSQVAAPEDGETDPVLSLEPEGIFDDLPTDDTENASAKDVEAFTKLWSQFVFERDSAPLLDDLSALNPTEEQAGPLAEATKSFNEEYTAWRNRRKNVLPLAANNQSQALFEQQHHRRGTRDTTMEQLMKYQTLYREKLEIFRKRRLAITKLLTPEQRRTFHREILEAEVAKQMKGITLSKEQTAQLEALYETGVKKLVEPSLKGDEMDDVAKLIAKHCYDDILSDEQREEVDER